MGVKAHICTGTSIESGSDDVGVTPVFSTVQFVVVNAHCNSVYANFGPQERICAEAFQ